MTWRAGGFLIAALLLYLFGNQTQIGWLYVMAALLGGLVVVGFLLSRGALKRIAVERSLSVDVLYEGDMIAVDLRLKRQQGLAAYQVELTETCPLLPPDEREKRVYAPVIPNDQALTYSYPITIDRRGEYDFPPVTMRTGFPFGFFRRCGVVSAVTNALVYPEVKPIPRFPLLERQLAAEIASQRTGHGGEVIGVRPFRSGDSPRHVHWRSTARAGQLMSKEFADETQPTLTLLFDTSFAGSTALKANPFDWAVKCTVSIADYARRRGFPFRVVHGDQRLPSGDLLSWESFLQLMARIQPSPVPFNTLTNRLNGSAMIVAVIADPNLDHVVALSASKARGLSVTAVLLAPSTFPSAANAELVDSAPPVIPGVDAITIQYPTDHAAQLSAAFQPQGITRETHPAT